MKIKKIIALAICITVAGSLLISCRGGNGGGIIQESPVTQPGETSYPINTDRTLTYWVDLQGSISANYKSITDTPLGKELENETGIKVQYIHPPAGQSDVDFNLMIASGNLPDIIEIKWITRYTGGPEKAIAENIIIPLNDVFKNYAPNMTKYMEANPNVERAVKTDSGKYFAFPFVRGDDILLTSYGPVVRKDWLDELNLPLPETISDWHAMLTAFKVQKGATAPFAVSKDQGTFFILANGLFSGAYGLKKEFFIDDGQVKYGAYLPEYKELLATLQKWYSEDLIDKGIGTTDGKAMDSYVLNGRTGAFACYPGSTLSKYVPAFEAQDLNAELLPVQFPVKNRGDAVKYTSMVHPVDASNQFTAITAKSQNVELAARFLDYGYTEKGNMLYNFGVEGESYNIIDGYPKMSYFVMNHPEGWSVSQAWSAYARATYSGPFEQRREYIEQYWMLPGQKEAFTAWNSSEAVNHILPPVSISEGESAQFSSIINNVKTYVDEYSLKVLLGTESLDNFDAYITQLKSFGIEDAIKMQQNAYDRYMNR
ncbi:MAG: extracellular solute-binding protein [Firmicutes bacterium]|nr:extracellular solute-binding protein [Bacillota bacterium]